MTNKRLNIKRKEFQDSYRRHYQLYQSTNVSGKSRRLLLFYSVECGLKCLIMKENGNNTYEEMQRCCDKSVTGHNIKAMLKQVNPRNEFVLKNISLENGGGSVPPEKYNELWRYGAAIEDVAEEIRAEKVLVKIAEWIHTRL